MGRRDSAQVEEKDMHTQQRWNHNYCALVHLLSHVKPLQQYNPTYKLTTSSVHLHVSAQDTAFHFPERDRETFFAGQSSAFSIARQAWNRTRFWNLPKIKHCMFASINI